MKRRKDMRCIQTFLLIITKHAKTHAMRGTHTPTPTKYTRRRGACNTELKSSPKQYTAGHEELNEEFEPAYVQA